ncbi:MAG: phosphoenolpyruvate synthase [Parcubacteria group bacterium CG11_big_fil_rev_8_21_14_0_20_39_14]|nr:MAG: phosphoenolpyruvate synthase [Parcubacteria group bacterium CG11_big_fil_rev_8_21_14_0_20_39_14]PIS34999.1 MAG: phosphoenolpyruvate synthase [Parcubacteria group bacterium CG08_land_8_20_14_0_20_38_56]
MPKFILWFEEISKGDVPLVGGKNASLGEMYQRLSEKGVQVPPGFAITAEAYKYLLREGRIEKKIKEILADLNTHDIKNLEARGEKVRKLIEETPLPKDLEKEIIEAYEKLGKRLDIENPDVAVRSSATAEDLADASFAGQQETYLNVEGKEELIYRVKMAFASLFTNRAISYREDKGFDHFDVYLSIAVQKMVRSDLASSGVIFTLDTESGFRDVVYLTGSWGLGEFIVQGTVNPDQFYVFKPTLKLGKQAIIDKILGAKDKKLIYPVRKSLSKGVYSKEMEKTREVGTSEEEKSKFVLDDYEILKLAQWACTIEEHYEKPMDIEWAKDGETGELFIVQARPETVHSQKKENVLETYHLEEPVGGGKILLRGEAVGNKIGRGEVNVVLETGKISEFRPGKILVTDMTNPDWEPIMKMAQAIITNRGGRTSHCAIVSRELGIPAVIGTKNATSVLKSGQKVTVDCSEGVGNVYEGLLNFRIEKLNLAEIPKTRTKIMMNVGIPEKAFTQGQIPCDGVGLAREEFIINSHIGIHPLALINYKELKKSASADEKIKKLIEQLDEKTKGWEDKKEFFIDKLAWGIARIGAAFWPNEVIVRFSDFKTNEYINLLGGEFYEPKESNPMLGWRGASRYYDPKFKEAFGLECRAIKKVREEMGIENVVPEVPFCRTPEEGRKVIETMKELDLVQGKNGLKVYMMVEIPSNAILMEEFCKIFDGFSIGSNDLTQLTLGLDRDSELVSHIYTERNQAVKDLIKKAIEVARKHNKDIGICGQAPSDFPDFAEFLVECDISSISLNPDTVIKTRLRIAEKEKKLGRI